MKKMYLVAMLLSAVSCLALAETDWGHDLDRFIAQPGTQVVVHTGKLGETREVRLASGVVFSQTREHGKIVTLENDESGHGAVKCLFGTLVVVKSALDTCRHGQDADLMSQLDDALERTGDFIVANSLVPTSKEDLRAEIDKATAAAKAAQSQVSAAQVKAYCESGDGAKMVAWVESILWRENFKKSLDDTLSVPRPAVTNPCM